jgi:hypothetical protein
MKGLFGKYKRTLAKFREVDKASSARITHLEEMAERRREQIPGVLLRSREFRKPTH